MSNSRKPGDILRDADDLAARVALLERVLGDSRHSYAFSNGWRVVNGGVAPLLDCGYFKDASGVVHMEGIIDKNGGNWVANEVMVTLPIGYRPPSTRYFSPFTSPYGPSRIEVASDGTVKLVNGGASNPVGYLVLDGISFRAEL